VIFLKNADLFKKAPKNMKNHKAEKAKNLNGKKLKIGIIFSRFNDSIGKELLKTTIEKLKKLGTKNIKIIEVPGTLEIPFAAAKLIKQKKLHAIIALGVVIKGETPHFDLVCQESHRGIMDLNLKGEIPIIFGIITAFNVKQAKERICKGEEYAETAIEMAIIQPQKSTSKS
jgi:6,7-dimethyl-8-ribityllumazine synthase